MSAPRVAVLGASGYIGGEAARLLLGHPHFDLVCVTGGESAGRRLDDALPNLTGLTDLVLSHRWGDADAYVLALGHGEAMKIAPELPGKVVDLSGDFRLKNPAVYERFYRSAHAAPGLLSEFAYGLPEVDRASVASSHRVAAAGCFASAAILSLWPLRNRVDGRVIIDGKTGSSGSGVKPGEKTHHPFRAGSLFAYESFHHRHVPEIEQATGLDVLFQPHSTPLVRGVFTTSYVPLREAATTQEVFTDFERAYSGCRFIRLSTGTPNVAHVRGSNFADIGIAVEGKTAIVCAAIDNLIKGGAGQGIQCLNLMFGFPEHAGLLAAPPRP